jgi:hypothetical protein
LSLERHLIYLFWLAASSALLASNVLREVVSKYVLKRSINAVLSLVAAVIKSPWFNVTSDPGIGMVDIFHEHILKFLLLKLKHIQISIDDQLNLFEYKWIFIWYI